MPGSGSLPASREAARGQPQGDAGASAAPRTEFPPRGLLRTPLTRHVDELSRHHDHLANRRGTHELLHIGSASAASRTVLSSASAGTAIRARSLPFTLHHQFNRRLLERRGVHRRATARRSGRWRGAIRAIVHGLREEYDRRQRQHRDIEGLLHHASILRGALRKLRQRVQQFPSPRQWPYLNVRRRPMSSVTFARV